MKNLLASAVRAAVVVKSDTTPLQFKRLFVGGAGNVTVQLAGTDASVTYTGVVAGSYLFVSGVRVMNATTATNIVAEDW